MNLFLLVVLLVACSSVQAISFSSIAVVSVALISLNQPVTCFFGIFRRRKAPPIQETIAPPPPEFFPHGPMSGGMFNPFNGFAPGGLFVPGLGNPVMNNPQFGVYGNRFPPQFKQSQMPSQNPPAVLPVHQAIPQQGMQQHSMQRFPPQSAPDLGDFNDFQGEDEAPGMNTEEAESFFTLLSETDESKCISRLVCEMGANPSSGGEFGQSIVEIIGSLKDFPDGSKVSQYNEVLTIGVSEGLSACRSKFSICDDESFNMVKKAQLEDENQSI